MKREVSLVKIMVKAPVGVNVQDMVNRMIGTAKHEATDLTTTVDLAVKIGESDFDVGPAEYSHDEGTDMECQVDFDDATYIGDEEDGVYYQVFQDSEGYWYMSAIVDSDTGGFCDSLATASGPYETRKAAEFAGLDIAADWCSINNVDFAEEK